MSGSELAVRERSGGYVVQGETPLIHGLDLLTLTPNGVGDLRSLVRSLAVRGLIVNQDMSDQSSSDCLATLRVERARLVDIGLSKSAKASMPVRAAEQPYAVPINWSWVRVADVCSLVTDGEHATPQRCQDPTAIPLVTAKNVRSQRMDYSRTDFVDRDVAAKCWVRCKPERDDILMVSVGATLGRLCVIRDPVDMVLVRSVTLLRPIHVNVYVDYLALHLMSSFSQREIWSKVKQSAQPGLYLAKTAALRIALPPLTEQYRIVARVEELMKLCDALEQSGRLADEQHARLTSTLFDALATSESAHALAENWQRVAEHFDLLLDRPEAIDALEQTVLRLAVRGVLVPQDSTEEPAVELIDRIHAGRRFVASESLRKRARPPVEVELIDRAFDVPKGWSWVRLNQIAESRLGKMLDKAKNSGSMKPYLRNTNLQWRRFELADVKLLRLEPHELKEYRLSHGDLLVCEGGQPGRCAIWRETEVEMYFQKAIHRVRPLGGVMAEFVELCFEQDAKTGGLDKYFTGATIKHFAGQELKRYALPLPPVSEQHRIVARVEQLRRLCTQLRERLTEARRTQSQLAEALVRSAHLGK